MRIAELAPIVERIPPVRYGGTERVVYELTEELVRRGHEVTLFATADSLTSARLASVVKVSLREANAKDLYGTNTGTLLHIGEAFVRQDEFDMIHDHLGFLALPTANIARTPVVTTMHGPYMHEVRAMYRKLRRPHLISISNNQRDAAPELNHLATVYNGLTLDPYPFGSEPGEYLLFVGRISMEKGTHLAIAAAMDLGLPLIIAAKLDKVDRPYFREYVEPYLSGRVQWIGEVDEAARNKLYSEARALLHPVQWREPFGLVLIEAMACGCPVLAMNKGSIPELVRDGVSGFVVREYEDLLAAIDRIDEIDRAACRDHALSLFSAKRMADGYEAAFREVLERSRTAEL